MLPYWVLQTVNVQTITLVPRHFDYSVVDKIAHLQHADAAAQCRDGCVAECEDTLRADLVLSLDLFRRIAIVGPGTHCVDGC